MDTQHLLLTMSVQQFVEMGLLLVYNNVMMGIQLQTTVVHQLVWINNVIWIVIVVVGFYQK